MFQVMVGMQDIGKSEKFSEAFKLFWTKVMEELKKGTSRQWLETSNFVVYVAPNTRLPIDFHMARDLAYEFGILAGEGELQEVPEPLSEAVILAFRKATSDYVKGRTEEIYGILDMAHQILNS